MKTKRMSDYENNPYTEYGIMLDCDKEGCIPRHSDHGLITFRHPSREQVETYKIDGKWWINNHAATLVHRIIPPWEPVQLEEGGKCQNN